jgi:catechol 2,3-dioxygenase-like lactoylglutathione lyase family enzyme
MDAAVEPLLAVADLDRSLAFWVDGVGAAVVTRWDTYALLDLGRGRLHLALTGEPPPDRDVRLVPPAGPDATAAVVLQVADCRATVAELEARGVTFLGPPSEPGWGDEVRAFARDPDGHLVEITSGS